MSNLFKISFCIFFSLLCSCGFTPSHVTLNSEVQSRASYPVEVVFIENRSGQQLRNHLLDLINPNGEQAASHTLSVVLRESQQDLSIKKSAISTRARLTIFADFSLAGNGKSFSGIAKVTTGYNLFKSEYATMVAEQNARSSGVTFIANEIANRVISHLNHQAPSAR